MSHMRTATQFLREIANHYYPDGITILFAKECHSSCLFSLIKTHYLCFHDQILCNLIVHDLFDLPNLFRSHCLSMAKVKTRSLSILIRTGLLYMISQHLPECFLQQMSCRMVLTGIATIQCRDRKRSIFTLVHDSGHHFSNMSDSASRQFDRILNIKDTLPGTYHTKVAFLTTHCCIKGCLKGYYGSLFSFKQGILPFASCVHRCNAAFCRQGIITDKLTDNGSIQALIKPRIFNSKLC